MDRVYHSAKGITTITATKVRGLRSPGYTSVRQGLLAANSRSEPVRKRRERWLLLATNAAYVHERQCNCRREPQRSSGADARRVET